MEASAKLPAPYRGLHKDLWRDLREDQAHPETAAGFARQDTVRTRGAKGSCGLCGSKGTVPAGLLVGLPWCGIIMASKGAACTAVTASRPGDARSPVNRIRRPASAISSKMLSAFSVCPMPCGGGWRTWIVESSLVTNRSPIDVSRKATSAEESPP